MRATLKKYRFEIVMIAYAVVTVLGWDTEVNAKIKSVERKVRASLK